MARFHTDDIGPAKIAFASPKKNYVLLLAGLSAVADDPNHFYSRKLSLWRLAAQTFLSFPFAGDHGA